MEGPATSTPRKHRLAKVISGGQTGVDRGALDAAIAANRPHGGKCPRGRLAEDGKIPLRYRLEELESNKYRVRTESNVCESDATLILYWQSMTGGTEFTYRMTRKHGKPCFLYDFTVPRPLTELIDWIHCRQIHILNCAGPRESSCPGIRRLTFDFMVELLSRV